jgi:hypothetical protein
MELLLNPKELLWIEKHIPEDGALDLELRESKLSLKMVN